MDFERRARDIKEEADKRAMVGAGRYSPELRAKALQYVQDRLASGGALRTVAIELGASPNTIRAWLDGGPVVGEFRKCEVAMEVPKVAAGSIVVHGPRGIRIEGLDVTALAALLRALS